MIHRFGSCELDTERFELRRGGAAVPMQPQVFDVLVHLLEQRERVVSKEELLDEVWGDRFVSESALTSRIKDARKAVGDDGSRQDVIRTVHGRGYRFVAPVEVVDESTSSPPPGGEAPRAPRPPPTDERAAAWPLLGRGELLEELEAAYRDPGCGGVLLTGPAGVGKSALAEWLAQVAAADGAQVARAAARADTASLPLAALSHLLPPEVTRPGEAGLLDRGALFHRARQALGEVASRRVFLVDDADHLDELSRALLVSEVAAGRAFLLLTVRRRYREPPVLVDLVQDARLHHVEVPYLEPATVEVLLHRVLGGPVLGSTVDELRRASFGNPGILRELVDASRRSGALQDGGGVWRLRGVLAISPDLEAVVERRVRRLDQVGMRAMEVLSVAGTIGLDLLTEIVGEEAVEALDAAGMVDVVVSGRRTDVRPAHPLYGEVVARQLSPLRGRRIRSQLAATVEARGARRREDRIRIVTWGLDGAAHIPGDLLADTARLALAEGDDALAERLLRRADPAELGTTALQLEAELRFRRGEHDEAERLFSHIDLATLALHDVAHVLRRRSANLVYGRWRPSDALAVLEGGLLLVDDADVRVVLESNREILRVLVGPVAPALSWAEAHAALPAGSARLAVLRVRAAALALAGRGEEALAAADEAVALHGRLAPDLAAPRVPLLQFVRATALTELGRLGAAEALLRAEPAAGVDDGWLVVGAARLALLRGRPGAVEATCGPYLRVARAVGWEHTCCWLLPLVARAQLLLGRVDEAAATLDELAGLEPSGEAPGLYAADAAAARAWLDAHRGDLAGARRILEGAARTARAQGKHAFEAQLLHDVARLGAAADALPRLEELAAAGGGRLLDARRLHAAGAVAGDPDLLARAVAAFEAIGTPLLAAEAAAERAGLLRRRGRSQEAATASSWSDVLRQVDGQRLESPALPAGADGSG